MRLVSLLVHVEQYDVLGILPSQLESLAHVAHSAGIHRCAFVDETADGVKRTAGFERYSSLQEWLEQEKPAHLSVFSPGLGTDLRDYIVTEDTWLVFGKSMGITLSDFDGYNIDLVNIPGGGLNSRDAVPIALWEIGSWPGQ